MNFENIKDWKDLARKFNFREEDFTKEFVDDITSGLFAVGGMAYGGPHGFFTYEYRPKTLWLNNYNFYSEVRGTFYTNQDYGRGKCGRLEHVNVTYYHDQIWKETYEKLEKKAKIRDYHLYFNEKREEKANNFFQQLKTESHKFIQNLLNSKINNLNVNDLVTEIKNEIEKRKDEFNHKIIDFLNNLSIEKLFNEKLSKINIYLLGKTGVGKSTLINSILDLKDEEKAKEGFGIPITNETKAYTSDTISWVRLFDNQGFESIGYGVQEATEYAFGFIKKLLLDPDPNKQIHLIWYCVTGSRFEQCEKEILLKLMNAYEDSKLPIIIVYTQATKLSESKNMIQHINEQCQNLGRNILSCSLIAKDFNYEINNEIVVQKSFGMKELLEISKSKIIDAVNSSFYESLKAKILDKYINLFEEKFQILKDNILKKTQINDFDRVSFNNSDEYFKKIKENLIEIIKEIIKLIIQNIDEINLDKFVGFINNYNDKYIVEQMKNIYAIYEKEYLTNELNKLSADICSLQVEGEKKYEITISDKLTKEQLKEKLMTKYNESKYNYVENSIITCLYEKIGVLFVYELGNIIKNIFHLSLNEQKEKLQDKIKEIIKANLDIIKNNNL